MTELRTQLTIQEVAEKFHVTPQAVYNVIRKGILKPTRVGRRYFIDEADYNQFRAQKYSRDHLYSREEKELSPRQAAKFFGISEQVIYKMIKCGRIQAKRKGLAIILNFDDCLASIGDGKQMDFA